MTSPNMLRQNDICCSQPPDPALNYTVCFPALQNIPTATNVANPFYDVANQQSFWTYTIQIDSGTGQQITNLSHWDLQICSELAAQQDPNDFNIEVSADGINYASVPSWEVKPGGDPSLPVVVPNVLKINQTQSKGTTRFYRITILDPAFFDLAAETGTVVLKQGNNPPPGFEIFDSTTCGDNALPTPSVNCNRQPSPELSLIKECSAPPFGRNFFIVGDTATITLTVDNTGGTATNVTVLDQINVPAGVTISSLITNPPASNINPSPGPYTNTNITVTWLSVPIAANSTQAFTVTFTIQAAPVNSTVITNVDAGIGQLSGTDRFRCIIPISHLPLPPIPPPKVTGFCEKILAHKVVADQVFICNDTQIVDLGRSFPDNATLGNYFISLTGVDCLLSFTLTNEIAVDVIYHFHVDAMINVPPDSTVPVSADFDLNCQGIFCGVTADAIPEGARDQVECRSLRNTFTVVEPIPFDPSNPDFEGNATLTVTITVISKFLLLQIEQLIVGVCSGKNTAEISIPITDCGNRYDLQEITEEIKELIRHEIKSYFDKLSQK